MAASPFSWSCFACITSLALWVASCSVQAGNNDWQSTDYIERAFIEIALKNEYESNPSKVRKWTTPIRYDYVYDGVKPLPMVQTLFKIHFAHLQRISGHSIEASQTAAQTNFRIVLTRDRQYRNAIARYTQSRIPNLEKDSHCLAHLKTSERGAIQKAVVILPLDHVMSRGLLPACVVEETTQAMGLPNDSDWVNPSIANDRSRLDLLTGLDYIMLKLLYSPELKPGMNVQQTRKIIHSRLIGMQQSGELKAAAQAVNRHGLYPLLY